MYVTIESCNRILKIMNRINFMLHDIISDIDAYVLLDKVGQYTLLSEEQSIRNVDTAHGIVIVYTSCYVGTGWVRDDYVTLELMLFDMDDKSISEYLYNNGLHMVKQHISEKRRVLEQQLTNTRAADMMIDSYLRRGLEYEVANEEDFIRWNN